MVTTTCALVIRHENYIFPAWYYLSSVAYWAVPYFATICHKRKDFWERNY